MNKYLLLRDNKESGPYSSDELQQKGLKAYDLVWAEGKSAAWRYPSEVEELKAFAPAVEEQPFDRFYKKPMQQAAGNPVVAGGPAINAGSQGTPVINAGTTSINNNPSRNNSDGLYVQSGVSGKRSIYVNLPAAKVSAVQPSSPAPRAAAILAASELPVKPVEPVLAASMPAMGPVFDEDILSQPHQDWRRAGEFQPRHQRGGSRSGTMKILLLAGSTLALLIAGVFIGMSIDKHSLGFTSRLTAERSANAAGTTPPSPVQHETSTGTLSPASASMVSAVVDSSKNAVPAISRPVATSAEPVAGARNAVYKISKQSGQTLKTPGTAADGSSNGKDSSVTAYAVGHREASHRTDMAVEKMDKDLVRNNLSNLVSLGSSKYTVGAFGGISDLQLTVSNRSVYSLDLVVVEIQYIQANKKVFKTENLYFRSIAAGSALMQEAPKSSRGIRVQYKITLVNSKELGLSYSAL